jgi:hypothetical protein
MENVISALLDARHGIGDTAAGQRARIGGLPTAARIKCRTIQRDRAIFRIDGGYRRREVLNVAVGLIKQFGHLVIPASTCIV